MSCLWPPLLQPLELGPLQWQAAAAQREQGLMGAPQPDEELMLRARECNLSGLERVDEGLLSNLASRIAGVAHALPRGAAARLLRAPVVSQLLDMEIAYSPQVNRTGVSSVACVEFCVERDRRYRLAVTATLWGS